MKRRSTLAIGFVMALAIVMVPGPAGAQTAESAAVPPVRVALPNDFCVEILGRALLYDFSYQRMLSAHVGLEGAVSALGGGSTTGDEGSTAVFGSLGARLYMLKKEGSPFVTAGGVLVSVSTDAGPLGDDDSSASYGYLGAGFEFRSRGGMLFRGTAYGLVADGGFFIWPGLTVGYAF
jgi:hypothetical protein